MAVIAEQEVSLHCMSNANNEIITLVFQTMILYTLLS